MVAPDLASPHAGEGELRITWVGHATSLIQLPGLNILTDPVWSDRSSPVGLLGPRRFVPAIPTMDALPKIDVVLISHDHYDHLDHATVVALRKRFGDETVWLTPLGYRRWFARRRVARVVERDWWESAELPAGFRAIAVPARHWTRRRPGGTNSRLWCGWVLDGGSSHRFRIYYAGDSGYCPAFEEIGARHGPFDLAMIPVGAYEPRWFMSSAHMNPEEAVQAYQDLGRRGVFVGIHWGGWRLTFEDPLEPPIRTRAAWLEAGLPLDDLHLPRHGETIMLRRSAGGVP
jgi:N-acyl-phosphatidylethanolamine-hydrolysing phospholipase D